MIQRIADRMHREDKGFTLIELMVVVLIIAILIAIAIPTFLGARRRAQDRAAQSSLRNTVTGAKAIFTDRETYVDASATALASGEPALTFVTGASDEQNEVSIDNSDADTFWAAVLSKSGTCWYVRDAVDPNSVAGTTWGYDDDGTTTCTAGHANTNDALFTASNKEPANAAKLP